MTANNANIDQPFAEIKTFFVNEGNQYRTILQFSTHANQYSLAFPTIEEDLIETVIEGLSKGLRDAAKAARRHRMGLTLPEGV